MIILTFLILAMNFTVKSIQVLKIKTIIHDKSRFFTQNQRVRRHAVSVWLPSLTAFHINIKKYGIAVLVAVEKN